LRLAYVCADRGIPVRGTKGASAHLRNLTAALVRAGHHVVLACARLEGPNPPPAGAGLIQLPPGGGPDSYQELFEREAVDAVLERYSLDSGPARPAAEALGLPYALEVNAPLVDEAVRYRGLTDVESWRVRERAAISGAGRIIAVSTGVRQHVVECGAAPDSVAVIPNGADLARPPGELPDLRRELGLGGRLVVGFVGSLKPWHGVARLVDAMRGLPAEWALLVVGESAALETLRQAANGRAVFTGGVAQADVPLYLRAMDIAVAPFEPVDGFYFSPLKIAEYLAAGLPVVATSQGDVPAMVGDAGLLVPPGDTGALAGAIRRLGENPELRRRCGAAARARAAGMSWDAVAERVVRVLAG
jgi:glycosyltransferase involved in cell wall biosynthesis